MNKRHEIRITDHPLPVRVPQNNLFKAIYSQIDDEFRGLDGLSEAAVEKWMRMRSLVGEYIGNLYKHIQKCEASFCDLEIVRNDTSVTITLAHDGNMYDQLTKVRSINNTLQVLGAVHETFMSSSSVLHGFKVEIPFSITE